MPRPAKPTHLHVLEGTLNVTRHRKRQHEPKPRGELIDPRAWMDDEHREVWREQLRKTPAGLLKGIDGKAMSVWTCAAVAHARAARQLSSGGGNSQVVIRTKDGNPIVCFVPDPAAKALEGKRPLAAALVRRAMVEDTLEGAKAKAKRHRHAARHPRECRALEATVGGHGGFGTHDAFLARLRARRGTAASPVSGAR